jgi:integral membrane protein (TIGR01906 family)
MFQSLTHSASPIIRFANRLRWLPSTLFIIAVPVFLVTGSLTWAFNNIGLYEGGFEKYRIARASGITPDDLREVALDLRAYFNSGQEPLSVRTRIFGSERELFKEKEVHHMADVKRLLWGVYAAFAVSAVCLIGLTALGFAQERRSHLPALARRILWGGGLTIGLLVAFGLVAAVGFDALFLLFHRVSFANDFWKLDPRTDYLVLLFPQGFWFDATMWVALRSLAGGLALAAAGGGYLAWQRWSAHSSRTESNA